MTYENAFAESERLNKALENHNFIGLSEPVGLGHSAWAVLRNSLQTNDGTRINSCVFTHPDEIDVEIVAMNLIAEKFGVTGNI